MPEESNTIFILRIHTQKGTCDINVSSFIHQGEIHRVKSDGTNRTEFAPAAILGSPVGLALDWLTENLYYTNPATQSIEVRQIILCPVVVFSCYYWLHMAASQSIFFSKCTSNSKIQGLGANKGTVTTQLPSTIN